MLNLLTGDSQGLEVETKATLAELADSEFETLFDVLTEQEISWKFYVGQLGGTSGEAVVSRRYTQPDVPTPAAMYWAPIMAMPRFWIDPLLAPGLANQEEFFADAASGNLPTVSFVLPLPTDHPTTSPEVSHPRLRSILNAIVKSPSWENTATFVVWDDWGGFYDHVPPPDGLGFRVPALLVSPFARSGHVSHVQHEHRSVLGFIVDRFGLPDFSTAQAGTADFDEAFDFDKPPRPGPLFASNLLPATPVGADNVNRVTLLLYLAALAAVATAAAVLIRRRRSAPEPSSLLSSDAGSGDVQSR